MKGYSKYRARKTTVDGIKFDSQKEARRYKELKLLERGKAISDLKLQPKFELIPKQKYQGKTLRKTSYIADFQYYDIKNDKVIVEDVKGYLTDVYKLKKKMFLYKYGDKYDFREI